MLCTNGHNNEDSSKFCGTCGINTFQPGSTFIGTLQVAQYRTTNGLAIASLVLGIVWIYGIGSVLALIFGIVARRQIRERSQGGSGMATAGIILGSIGIVGVILLIVVVVFFVHTASTCHYNAEQMWVCN